MLNKEQMEKINSINTTYVQATEAWLMRIYSERKLSLATLRDYLVSLHYTDEQIKAFYLKYKLEA